MEQQQQKLPPKEPQAEYPSPHSRPLARAGRVLLASRLLGKVPVLTRSLGCGDSGGTVRGRGWGLQKNR